MDLEQFNEILEEVRATEHDEPAEMISRLELMAGNAVTLRLMNGLTYEDIRDFADWDDLMTLCHADGSQLDGLSPVVDDHTGETVNLLAKADRPEIDAPSGTTLVFRQGFLDVYSWRGWTPSTSDSYTMYYSTWAVDDPKRIITLIGAAMQYPHFRTLEPVSVPDGQKRKVREWAKKRYGLTRFEGLVIPE